MYCYLLEFSVREGEESEFIESWSELTEHIRREHGGLGSRLHRTPDGRYLAYAQWPDAESRGRAFEWSAEGAEIRRRMMRTLEAPPGQILPEMEVILDLLE